ncbi:ABC transporter permease [Nesterenkonia salmonea]|uniref:ABC transporter permease n=1 Tax=Nesterenkonia salmonea TaxID=1804987 RepID=A0A5R9BJD3_9MICC|nr:ABC transporter permease [Nesterenkonia salmonea]TLQ00270.1 ABC transporter permease [Nesterenkonia salmonea]
MLKYSLKRFGSTIIVLFGATLLCFPLLSWVGDPLEDLRYDTDPNAEFLMQQRIDFLGLDDPWYVRYWDWLSGVLGCLDPTNTVLGECDFGTSIGGSNVTDMIVNAAAMSLRLVLVATLISIVLGIGIGIISAIRQYSTFDYFTSFIIFLFWSLPPFVAAIIGKEYLAIQYNNWMGDPRFSAGNILLMAIILAIAVPIVMGGSTARRVITGSIMFVYTCTVMPLLDHMHFMEHPRIGPIGLLVLGLMLAVGLTALISGLKNRRVLYVALGVVAAAMISYYATWELLRQIPGGYLLLIGLFVLTIALCVIGARLFGGYAKGQATVVAVVTGVLMSALILLDHYMYSWPGLLSAKPRPVRTIGAETPNLQGDWWIHSLDHITQLWIPSLAMALMSIATYTRYTRASMLEVNKQDYIRTARAKGVEERTVVLKHAFRNSLIPLATIVAFDFASLIGGSIIVERVFGWNAMGQMLITGIQNADPAPVMAVVVFTGFISVLFNFFADLIYGVLDPRIRVS